MTWFYRLGLLGLAIAAFVTLAPAQGSKFSIKVVDQEPPAELSTDMKKLLSSKAIQLQDAAGKTLCEVWMRPEIPADATPEQIKNGLTYKEVKQTEVLGAIRFPEEYKDYRKQKLKAGVYTLRLGFQPADGDHMGSSEFQDFLLVIDAAKDQKPETMDAKHMIDLSIRSLGMGHPGVFMLFPSLSPKAMPELTPHPKNHWVLNSRGEVLAGGKKTGANLGIGLTIVGAAD